MSLDASPRSVAAPTRSPDAGTPKPTVQVKSCCEILRGEACDCAEQAATARGLFLSNRVIMCRPASEWNNRG